MLGHVLALDPLYHTIRCTCAICDSSGVVFIYDCKHKYSRLCRL